MFYRYLRPPSRLTPVAVGGRSYPVFVCVWCSGFFPFLYLGWLRRFLWGFPQNPVFPLEGIPLFFSPACNTVLSSACEVPRPRVTIVERIHEHLVATGVMSIYVTYFVFLAPVSGVLQSPRLPLLPGTQAHLSPACNFADQLPELEVLLYISAACTPARWTTTKVFPTQMPYLVYLLELAAVRAAKAHVILGLVV